jgi:hypothetical protein
MGALHHLHSTTHLIACSLIVLSGTTVAADPLSISPEQTTPAPIHLSEQQQFSTPPPDSAWESYPRFTPAQPFYEDDLYPFSEGESDPDAVVDSPSSEPVSQKVVRLQGAVDRIDVLSTPEHQWVALGVLESQTVQLLDLSNEGEKVWEVPVGFEPSVVQIDPVRLLVYASGPSAPGLVILDLKTGELVQAYGLPGGALALAVDLQMGRIFATIPSTQSVAVITLTQPEARNLPVPGVPLATAYDETTGNVLVSLAGNDPLGVLVVNPDNGELLARWRSGDTPEDMVIDTQQQRLVILNSGSQDLTLIDLKSNGQQVQQIGLNWRPTRVALADDYAYVTSRDNDRLQVVNLKTGRLQATYDTEAKPTGVEILNTPSGPGILLAEAGMPQLQWLSLDPGPSQNNVTSTDPVPVGTVVGKVMDIAQQPVTEGKLNIAPTPFFPGRQGEIKPDGTYLLTGLPAGVHLVDVEVPGFPVTTTQVQVRAGFVSTQDIQLPPAQLDENDSGIGLLPDAPTYSDELARHLEPALEELEPDREVILLNGPTGPDERFQPLLPLVENLTLLDRDERYTEDLRKLQLIGNALGLRYILLTQLQISRDYSRRGNGLLNTAVRFLVPVVPVEIPNFTPNMLRSRGLVVVVDLHQDNPGDQARYYEAYGRDDVGGRPMYEDAAAGLFRLQVRNMIPVFKDQFQQADPFVDG